MTITADAEAHLRSDMRRRAWMSAGATLLACSVGLTWLLAGAWLAGGLLVLLAAAGLGLSARLTARRARSDRPGALTAGTSPDPFALPPGPVPSEALIRGLRHDLPLMVALCQRLPSGGLPQAGLLAEHTRVVCDALGCLLAEAPRECPASLALARAAAGTQLVEVSARAERLYSAERPGGLDHLDWHLARLWVLVEEYLVERDPAASAGSTGSDSLSHRRRARVLAWSATATGDPTRGIGRGQPRRTRAWLSAGILRRSARRSRRLWGAEPRPAGHDRPRRRDPSSIPISHPLSPTP